MISLAVTAQGDLIAGTDSGGLVLRVSPEGKTFALFDTQLREIHALAPAADGSIYALALSDAAATARAPSTPAVSAQPSEGTTPSTSVTITALDETGAPQTPGGPTRSRSDVSNARSAVFRILPDGATDVVWSSTTVTAFRLRPRCNQVVCSSVPLTRVASIQLLTMGATRSCCSRPKDRSRRCSSETTRSTPLRVIRESCFVSAMNS